jgi:hypothetical protein
MPGILRKITDSLTKELRAILREFAYETEKAAKKRLKRLVIYGIVTSILVSLVISLLGSAALFLLLGLLEYLRIFMPAWKAWDIVGLTAGVVAGLFFLGLFAMIRKELKT